MTITNTTPAAAPSNVLNSEQPQIVFFGIGTASHTSQLFTVDQHPFYLAAFNLGSDDTITVQQVFGAGSGTEISSFIPINNPVVLKQSRTKVRIDHPGRYRLFHAGSSPLGTFTVIGAPALMTVEPFADLGEALYNIFTNLGGNITVTSPITLGGGGTSANPYVIGFETNTVTGSAPLSVTGSGTHADPYVIHLSTTPGSAPPNFVEVTAGNGMAVSGDGTAATPYIVTFSLGSSTSSGTSGRAAFGVGASATGTGATAIGSNAQATANGTAALGTSATASATSTTALGSGSSASAATATAVGASASAAANGATAVGGGASASHSNEISIGNLAGVGNTFTGTITIASAGTATNPTQDDQIVLGTALQTQLVTAGSIIQGGVISASDERLKVDIEAEWNALELVERLAPVTFYWDETAVAKSKIPLNADEFIKKQHGLLAQEVEEVLPELVETIDRGAGPYKFVRYERLITILLAAIQELNEKVNELEKQQ